MKNNKMRCACLTVICIFFLSSNLVFGQTWSDEQKEVWAQTKGRWQAWVEGDYNKGRSFVAEEYRGWNGASPGPYTVEEDKPWVEHWLQTNKIILMNQHPFAIDIYGDFAIVFWSTHIVSEQKDGSERETETRWTDIYRKIDGKWLLISSYFDND